VLAAPADLAHMLPSVTTAMASDAKLEQNARAAAATVEAHRTHAIE
jgi:hypothetical protein